MTINLQKFALVGLNVDCRYVKRIASFSYRFECVPLPYLANFCTIAFWPGCCWV